MSLKKSDTKRSSTTIPKNLDRKPRIFKATLSHPVSVNASYRIGYNQKTRRRVVIKTKKISDWESQAYVELQNAGFCPQPEGVYWIAISIDLYTSRQDIDASVKSTLDLVMKSLSTPTMRKTAKMTRTVWVGVDDKWVGQLIVHKHFCKETVAQRLEITVELNPLKSKTEFNAMTEKRRK